MRPPPRIPDPEKTPHGAVRYRGSQLYRFRLFCLQAGRGAADGVFWGSAMIVVNGFEIHKGWLDAPAQAAMAADIAAVAEAAPFFAPLTPWGKPMSVG